MASHTYYIAPRQQFSFSLLIISPRRLSISNIRRETLSLGILYDLSEWRTHHSIELSSGQAKKLGAQSSFVEVLRLHRLHTEQQLESQNFSSVFWNYPKSTRARQENIVIIKWFPEEELVKLSTCPGKRLSNFLKHRIKVELRRTSEGIYAMEVVWIQIYRKLYL
jgi:hypothetical protein